MHPQLLRASTDLVNRTDSAASLACSGVSGLVARTLSLARPSQLGFNLSELDIMPVYALTGGPGIWVHPPHTHT